LLGYTTDLRNHPVRFMLHKGLQASISSDDPGFFGYDGVTMDYLMVALAWELDLRDLKKLSLNGITYSSISPDKRAHLKNVVFP
jgi:adenosine deaminase CECR1